MSDDFTPRDLLDDFPRSPIPPATGAGDATRPTVCPACSRPVAEHPFGPPDPCQYGWLDRLQAGGKSMFTSVTDEALLALDSSSTPASEGTPAPCLECPDCGYTDWASTFRKIDAASHGYGPTSPAPVVPQPPDALVSETPDRIEEWDERVRALHAGADALYRLADPPTELVIDESFAATLRRMAGEIAMGAQFAPDALVGETRTLSERAERHLQRILRDSENFSAGDSYTEIARAYAALRARQSPDAGGAEAPQERVNRILTESRQAVQPTIDAEAQGENVGDVMDFVVRSPDTRAGVGTPSEDEIQGAELLVRLDHYAEHWPTTYDSDKKARKLFADAALAIRAALSLQARNAELEAWEEAGLRYQAALDSIGVLVDLPVWSTVERPQPDDPPNIVDAVRETLASQAARIGELEADKVRLLSAAEKVRMFARHHTDCPTPRTCECGLWELWSAIDATRSTSTGKPDANDAQ